MMPPALFLMMMLVAPEHMNTFVSDPLGVRMIIVALVLQVIGTLAIRAHRQRRVLTETIMTADLALPLAAVFISVALGVGSLASMALGRTSPARRRLQPTVGTAPSPQGTKSGLFDQLSSFLRPGRSKTRTLSKTPQGASSKVSRLQRRMELAGWTDPEAAGYYALAEMVVPIICGLLPLALMGTEGWLLAIVAAVLGYLVPDVVLTRATRQHQKAIQNGLPDAIDLIVVCVEAGSSLDQAIMRASEELELAHAGARA